MYKGSMWIPLICILFFASSAYFFAYGFSWTTYEGYVFDEEGIPLPGVTVQSRYRSNVINCVKTDERGYYSFNYVTGHGTVTLIAFKEQQETEGSDFLPSIRYITETVEHLVSNFTLTKGATVHFEGQFLTVEPNIVIQSYEFQIINLKSEKLDQTSFDIVYGSSSDAINQFIGIPDEDIVIPVDSNFSILIRAEYCGRHETGKRSRNRPENAKVKYLTVWDPSFTEISQGDLVSIKLSKYLIDGDLPIVEELHDTVSAMIVEAEANGFYTTHEKIELSNAGTAIMVCRQSYNYSQYDEAFTELGSAMLTLSGLKTNIENMNKEASFSVNLIVGIIILTSLTISIVITEDNFKRVLVTGGVSLVMLVYIYNVYPGCRSVPLTQIPVVALTSLIGIILSSKILSEGFKRIGGSGLNMTTTVSASFLMGRRNLVRRHLRSLFTFSTLLVLTMSFVALTSLSTMYGLSYFMCGSAPPGVSGLFVRMPEYQITDKTFYDFVYPEDAGYFYVITDQVVNWLSKCEGVEDFAFKAERMPSLGGIHFVGVQPAGDPIMPLIDEKVTLGEPLREDGTCLVHESLIGTRTEIGGVYENLRVVGAFSNTIDDVMDLDGSNILPYKQIIVMQGEHTTTLGAEKCNPDEFIITTYDTAVERLFGATSKVTVLFEEGVNLEMACKSMALSSEFRFWHSDGEQTYYARMGDIISGKGMPILVPWGIVILTVIATMLGTMHERRGEINILSSIGLNPAHISTVFMTEALILGILAGGFGYLLGLGWYPIMAEFSLAPDVKQKVSALWSVASIAFSIISVIVGTFFSLWSSAALTPSLRRRWNASADFIEGGDKYEIALPIQLNDSTVAEFTEFAESELIRRVHLVYGKIGTSQQGFSQVIKRLNDLGDTTLSFGYTNGGTMDSTINRLQVSRDPGNGEYHVTLNTVGSPKGAKEVGLLMRKVVMKWSNMYGRNTQQ